MFSKKFLTAISDKNHLEWDDYSMLEILLGFVDECANPDEFCEFVEGWVDADLAAAREDVEQQGRA